LALRSSLSPLLALWPRKRRNRKQLLPFADRSFDAVVCQFGLMFFADRNMAVREMLRVMVPGGHCAVAVWDTLENAPAFAALVSLLDRIAGKAAGDALRAPFVLGDRRLLANLFGSAEAGSINVTTHQGTARFPSTHEFVEAEVKGWLPVMGVILPEPTINRILAEAENVLARYAMPAGGLAFDVFAHVVSSRKL
jgi:SAM-dependent methyltransferase